MKKENPGKPIPNINNTKTVKGPNDFIPLYALAKSNRKLFILTSVWNMEGMQPFINKNRKIILSNENLLNVPSYIYKAIQGDIRKTVDYLKYKNVLTIIADVTDLKGFFVKISEMNPQKGEICFVSNAEEEIQDITQLARETKIFVQIFSMSPDGNLWKTIANKQLEKRHSPTLKTAKDRPRGNGNINNRFLIRSTPELMKVLAIYPERVTPGSLVYDSKSTPVRIGTEQLSHPNATTYSTDRPGISAKIYTSNVNTFLEKKVERMLSRDIRHKGLCWPIDILRDGTGKFTGYLLPEAAGEPLHLSIFKRARFQQMFPSWTKMDLCDLALNILEQIKYLHNCNILLGCINPAAIRVVDKDNVFFLDTDNYQVEGFPTLVHNLTFTPPELLGKKIYLCTKENDNYGIALLLFMLMMPGKLPYNLGNGSTPEERILHSRFSFSFKDEHGSQAMPSAWRFMWSHLTPFKPLFYSTFKKGERYSDPNERRTIDEWIGTLRYYRKDLESPFDSESLKLYPETFKRSKDDRFFRCSCCNVSHPEFYFYNPQSATGKICNGCIDKMSNVSFTCQCCGKTYYYTNRTALFHRTKKESDSDWKDQKYCSDCKNKTVKCCECGNEKPYFLLKNGRCPDCNKKRLNAVYATRTCKDCGCSFPITVGQHESLSLKGLNDPVRCESCRKKRKSF